MERGNFLRLRSNEELIPHPRSQREPVKSRPSRESSASSTEAAPKAGGTNSQRLTEIRSCSIPLRKGPSGSDPSSFNSASLLPREWAAAAAVAAPCVRS